MDRHRQEQELIICSLIAGCAGQLDPWLDEASRPYQVAILAVIYPVSGAAELITNGRRVSPARHVAWLPNTVRFQSARLALPPERPCSHFYRTPWLQPGAAPHRLLPPTPVAVSRRVTGGAFTLLAMARAILGPDNNRERDRLRARDATDAPICALMLLVCAC